MINMSVTAIDEFESELTLPTERSRAYVGPLLVSPKCIAPSIQAEMERCSELAQNGLGCLRGTAFGLIAEAVAGLCLYAAWQLWHILR
jgi:hypothetical protein